MNIENNYNIIAPDIATMLEVLERVAIDFEILELKVKSLSSSPKSKNSIDIDLYNIYSIKLLTK